MEDLNNTITLYAGNVEYSLEEAVVTIDDFISLLESAKEEGAEHVVFLSGNHRGAQYVRVPGTYDWVEDNE